MAGTIVLMTTTFSPQQRFDALGLVLPPAPKPEGVYRPGAGTVPVSCGILPHRDPARRYGSASVERSCVVSLYERINCRNRQLMLQRPGHHHSVERVAVQVRQPR